MKTGVCTHAGIAPQSDMALVFLGAIIALTTLWKWHDRQLRSAM